MYNPPVRRKQGSNMLQNTTKSPVRLATWICVLLFAGGCASQSAKEPAVSSVAPVGAEAKSEPHISRDAAFKRAAKNYQVSRRNGEKVYCRDQTPLGSHVSKSVCLTRDQLEASIVADQESRDTLRPPRARTCSGGGAGGGMGCN
jgi:hypothetical protein